MALSIIARLLGRGGRAAHSVRDTPPDLPEHPSSHEALSTPAVATQPLRPADAGTCGDDDTTLAKVQVEPESLPQQERTLSQEAAPWQEAQPEPTAQVKPEGSGGTNGSGGTGSPGAQGAGGPRGLGPERRAQRQ